MMDPAIAWKLVLAITLAGTIFASACARAPRRALPLTDLRCLVAAALILYGVGIACRLAHHPILAAVGFAGGIGVSALTAWLSRGAESDGPRGGEGPADEEPPLPEGGPPAFDWAAFERDLGTYERRRERDRDRLPVA